MNTAGCTTSWMNCANEPSQAALEWASQDVYDVIASRQGGCVETRQCGTFERMNIQNVLNSQLYNRQYECLHNWLYNRLWSVYGPLQWIWWWMMVIWTMPVIYCCNMAECEYFRVVWLRCVRTAHYTCGKSIQMMRKVLQLMRLHLAHSLREGKYTGLSSLFSVICLLLASNEVLCFYFNSVY